MKFILPVAIFIKYKLKKYTFLYVRNFEKPNRGLPLYLRKLRSWGYSLPTYNFTAFSTHNRMAFHLQHNFYCYEMKFQKNKNRRTKHRHILIFQWDNGEISCEVAAYFYQVFLFELSLLYFFVHVFKNVGLHHAFFGFQRHATVAFAQCPCKIIGLFLFLWR